MTGLLLAACAGGSGAPPGVATSLAVEVTPAAVDLTLHVTNPGEDPVVFSFPTAQRYDFWITTASGEEVWRWSAGRSFAQVVTTDTLDPMETWRVEGEWQPGARAGQFTAVGRLTARDAALEQRVTFELP